MRGLRWMTWALVAFLVVLLATAVALLVLGPEVFLASSDPTEVPALDAMLGNLSLAYVVLNIAVGAWFVVGFADLHSGEDEYGLEHRRAVGQAAVFLFVAFLLVLSASAMPTFTWPQLAVPWTQTLPSQTVLVAGTALPGFRAIFCGLVLVYSVYELADEVVRVRLLLAMTLGVMGAVVWPGALVYASIAAGTPDGRLVEYVVATVVGAGISAISLLLAIWCFRQTVRRLQGRADGASA